MKPDQPGTFGPASGCSSIDKDSAAFAEIAARYAGQGIQAPAPMPTQKRICTPFRLRIDPVIEQIDRRLETLDEHRPEIDKKFIRGR